MKRIKENESKNREEIERETELISQPNQQLSQEEDWKNISEEFTEELQKDWEENGFDYQTTKQWIEVGVKVDAYKFASYLRDIKKVAPEWTLNNEQEFKNLAKTYKKRGLCQECQQLNTAEDWCQFCMSQHFQDNFANWTSGNEAVDKIIQKCQLEATNPIEKLEWIPYEKFTDIEHLADGGFSKVYKAKLVGLITGWNNEDNEWERGNEIEIVLKSLDNSQGITTDFLQELTHTKLFSIDVDFDSDDELNEDNFESNDYIVPCFGISQDPNTNNYVMVMLYVEGGNLRKCLQDNKDSEWEFDAKLAQLFSIALGLNSIHKKGLIHKDFHTSNILMVNDDGDACFISDLGLSRPVNEVDKENEIYGVLPYVAPEVLQGKPYTQASDIYSFGIIAYEILTCLPPYYKKSNDNKYQERPYDTDLILEICQGLRPQFSEQVKIPQFLTNLIKRCWETEPAQRPTAHEIVRWFFDLLESEDDENSEIAQQIEETEEFNKALPNEVLFPNYERHAGAVYHSKAINTQQITQLLQKLGTREEYHTKALDELVFDNFNLDELNISEDPQAESSTQTQTQIPPK